MRHTYEYLSLNMQCGLGCEVTHDLVRSITVVHLRGVLTTFGKHSVRGVVRKALCECPQAVIVDLRRLIDHTTTTPSMLSALHDSAEQDYGVALLWVTPTEGCLATRLYRDHWRQTLHIFDTVEDATAAAIEVPPPSQVWANLPAGTSSATRAAGRVDRACRAWDLPALATPAERITFELVDNAVTHAGTPVQVHAARRRRYLYISVRDQAPAPAELLDWQPPTCHHNVRDRDPASERGLHRVNRLAASWGVIPARVGKVVWATIRIPQPRDTERRTATPDAR